MNSSLCLRWLRIVAPTSVCLACALLGASLRPASVNASVLERELAFAIEACEPDAVREIARRLASLDPSPSRRLRLAEIFLQLGMHDDLAAALQVIEKAGGRRELAVEKLRALSAMTRGDHAEAIAAWESYLVPTADRVPADRVAALDSLARALTDARRWPEAITRLDERIALVDDVAPRLARANVLVCLRRWDPACAEFAGLSRSAPANPAVKPLLPAWERIERARPDLIAAEAAVTDDAPGPRLDRGLLAVRAGLWRSAVEDLSAVAHAWPQSRLAAAVIGLLGATDELRDPARSWRNIAPDHFPIFAPSERVLAVNAELEARATTWRALRACDDRIAMAGSVPPAERAEQARLMAELGFPMRALEDARDALKSAPGLLAAARVEIAVLVDLQRDSEAFEAVARAVRRHAHPDGTLDSAVARLAGLVWQKQGQHREAVEAFTAWLSANRSGEILRARGRSLRFLQRFAEAADDFAAADQVEAATGGKLL